LLGAKDYKTFSWMQLIAATNSPDGEFCNEQGADVASSAADFVSYYSRALQGEFFKNKETLRVPANPVTWGCDLALTAAAGRQRFL
jgi:beta-lactamase class A